MSIPKGLQTHLSARIKFVTNVLVSSTSAANAASEVLRAFTRYVRVDNSYEGNAGSEFRFDSKARAPGKSSYLVCRRLD